MTDDVKAAFYRLKRDLVTDPMRVDAADLAIIEAHLTPAKPEGKCKHEWSKDGERCLKCGDKDWM